MREKSRLSLYPIIIIVLWLVSAPYALGDFRVLQSIATPSRDDPLPKKWMNIASLAESGYSPDYQYHRDITDTDQWVTVDEKTSNRSLNIEGGCLHVHVSGSQTRKKNRTFGKWSVSGDFIIEADWKNFYTRDTDQDDVGPEIYLMTNSNDIGFSTLLNLKARATITLHF